MEEVLLRFHYVGQQIFEQLDNESLAKCREVARIWQTFLDGQKFPLIRKIKTISKNPDEPLEKIFKYSGLEEVRKLANIACKINKESNKDWYYGGGQTSLHFAAASGQEEIFKNFLIYDGNKSPVDKMKRAPKLLANIPVAELIV